MSSFVLFAAFNDELQKIALSKTLKERAGARAQAQADAFYATAKRSPFAGDAEDLLPIGNRRQRQAAKFDPKRFGTKGKPGGVASAATATFLTDLMQFPKYYPEAWPTERVEASKARDIAPEPKKTQAQRAKGTAKKLLRRMMRRK